MIEHEPSPEETAEVLAPLATVIPSEALESVVAIVGFLDDEDAFAKFLEEAVSVETEGHKGRWAFLVRHAESEVMSAFVMSILTLGSGLIHLLAGELMQRETARQAKGPPS